MLLQIIAGEVRDGACGAESCKRIYRLRYNYKRKKLYSVFEKKVFCKIYVIICRRNLKRNIERTFRTCYDLENMKNL